MIILGLLLVLGTAGLSFAMVWANKEALTAPAGAIEVLGIQLNVSVGQVFLLGIAAGALALLGLFMMSKGMGRNARRRHQFRDQRHEMQDLQRKHDATSSDLAAHRAADAEAADAEAAEREGITARR